MGCRRHGRAVGRNDDGGERVAAGDGAGCSVGNDPFASVHATTELTMGAAGDEEKGNEYLCQLGFCTRLEPVGTCCRLIARREFALSKLL
ncbi:hypothetical protein GW17_00050528 [Ensete ventricosum]|nr:hypothetical protein GW17_00050528 [Ensete ventricosum]